MRCARFVLVVVVFACSDFDLVRREPAPAFLDVFISASHNDTTTLDVGAFLDPGIDSSGRPHRLADSIFTINGDLVSPATGSGDHPRWRRTYQRLPVATPDTLRLRFPVLAGQDSFAAARVVVPARLDPRDIAITSGEDLRLRLSPTVAPPGYELESARWSLLVGAQCPGSGVLQVQGANELPSEFRVPWEWIEAPAPFEREACVFVIIQYRSEQRTPPSVVFLSLFVSWRVQVSP
jgi:hypothetical protein